MSYLVIDLRSQRARLFESQDDAIRMIQELVEEGAVEQDLLVFDPLDAIPVTIQ